MVSVEPPFDPEVNVTLTRLSANDTAVITGAPGAIADVVADNDPDAVELPRKLTARS